MWPDGVIGSISHAHGFAMATVARTGKSGMLGIDIERVPDDTGALFDSDVLTDFERAWSGSSGERAIQIFSAKEAIFKAVYPACQRLIGYEEVELTATLNGFRASLCSKDSVLNSSLEHLKLGSVAFQGWV
jgi:enterobactin synthetase component D